MPQDVLPPTVIEALNAGHKVEAIKRLRGITGLGLKESKAWIDSYERSAAPPTPEFEHAPGHDPFADKIEKPIPAKAHRATSTPRTPTSAHARTGLAPGEVARGGGSGKWFALIVVAVLVALAALYY